MLGNRIRVLRAEKEVSQQQLADAVGVSRQTVNSIERGKFNPSVVTALKIALYFQVPAEKVFVLKESN